MEQLVNRLGFWSAIVIAVLVVLIDLGMILSAILYPMTTITSMEAYASSFSSAQMLPFIPSLLLSPMFIMLMLCIHLSVSDEKRILTNLGLLFSLICATILSIHYYIQLTVVNQGILNNELTGLWQLAAPNPHSLFWAFAALGYGFMGIALLAIFPVFRGRSDRAIKWLLVTNGMIGVSFLIGNALGFFIVDMLASFAWGVLFPITCLLLARRFRRSVPQERIDVYSRIIREEV